MNTKQKIIEEALTLFSTKGYDAVSVGEMADLYLLIAMCDRQPEREEEALELLKKHVEQFETLYKKTEV
ncbi:MAG: hypothetical protein PUA75_02740 [Clostridiales bacterium]|nr:hypothetical protein [Clostridiales bacterium]